VPPEITVEIERSRKNGIGRDRSLVERYCAGIPIISTAPIALNAFAINRVCRVHEVKASSTLKQPSKLRELRQPAVLLKALLTINIHNLFEIALGKSSPAEPLLGDGSVPPTETYHGLMASDN
jgi:hypothetical protein